MKSRFIATLAPVFSTQEAKEFINRIRQEFQTASHHVPVYILGQGSSLTMHCSDDGEPSGTAGKPALAVLKGSGLGNVDIVITRFYGGIKLGTGGLVRAYSEAVRQVLAQIQLAELKEIHTVEFILPYPLYDRTQILIRKSHGTIVQEAFTSEIKMQVDFFPSDLGQFQRELGELSHGADRAEMIATKP